MLKENSVKKFIVLCISLGFCLQGIAQSIEAELFLMPDVIFQKIDTKDGYEACYQLMVKQPLDHFNDTDLYFYQKVYFSFQSKDALNVLITEGYNRNSNRIYELSEVLKANQIQVEHRYYGESTYENIDYKYLNLKQATADYHRIKELFASFLNGKFISTGISKGGMTTLFYSYYYPDDVDLYVPYVAPINLEYKDDRVYTFLSEVGDEACRNKITAFQKLMLENRADFMPRIKWFEKGKREKFDQLGLDRAFELSVLEFSFSFWQYGHSCDGIPDKGADVDSLLTYFLSVSDPSFFADASIEGYAPFYYQMGTEMGYYGYNTDEFKGLLQYVDEEPSAVFITTSDGRSFDSSLTKKAFDYFTHELDRTVYIYGAIDTWSSTAVQPDKNLDVFYIQMDGKHHGNARIEQMDDASLDALDAYLERMLDTQIDLRD